MIMTIIIVISDKINVTKCSVKKPSNLVIVVVVVVVVVNNLVVYETKR